VVVIGELKLSFNLDLVLQAIDRTAACDEVWLAVGPAGRKRLRDPRVRKPTANSSICVCARRSASLPYPMFLSLSANRQPQARANKVWPCGC
jgi:hypothetical protein